MEYNTCTDSNCQNNICLKCDDENKHPSSNCKCKIGEYNDNGICRKCSSECESCYDSNKQCTSCKVDDNRILNYNNYSCDCDAQNGYIDLGSNNCGKCYFIGSSCVEECPKETKADENRICVDDSSEELGSDDDLVFMIMAISLILIMTFLSLLLYGHFSKRFRRFVMSLKFQTPPLCQEEKFYLANEVEMQRLQVYKDENKEEDEKRRQEELRLKELEEEEHRKRMKALEERIKKEEEERLKLEKLIEERKKLEEEERRRRQAEEERKKLMEEEMRKKKLLEQKLRMMELEEQERKLAEQEAKKRELETWLKKQRIQEEYAEKEKEDELMSAERIEQIEAQKKLEEEEKLQLDEEEKERRQLLQKVREKKRIRQQQRQKEKNAIQQANEKKIEKMREERNKIIQEKQNMEDYNADCIKKSKEIEEELIAIKRELQASIDERKNIKNKQIELNERQQRIQEERQQLDQELQGIDFSSAKDKLKKLQDKDITFLQHLRQPPERIRVCLEALITILKNSTKKIQWDQIKKEICSPVFRKQLFFYDPNTIQDKVFNKVIKEYKSHSEWDIEKIAKASVAAGIFAEWIEGIIEFKETKDNNLPLFEKMNDLKMEENQLVEEFEELDDLLFKSRELEEEEYALELQIKELEENQKDYKLKATENLDQIEEKEEEINNINTNDLTLEEIEDDDLESEIDSNIDIDDLKLLDV
ncbi:Insulin-like growth factor binding protein, N-terminal [Pseudocohnilembus persalinus]|uniref:Insulin-like growth factor binding protein, N-terminal n=1 Tax=Pseudocohnilembus persalinus TaxID=266149 RepID=A0A0V0QKE5_PSEPJ|nr:Insulin-like growth factor binding protein, N-terminal [Pseudocohnilembus persalinus]|eukprot:KRX02660.1 Insulin-like growth factor binding protein, N-terminal [Pseudocohnilembus persalinus]